MAPSKSRKGRYKNVGVTKDADLLKESSPVKNMENGNKTDELKHPNKHLEEVILLISRSHNKGISFKVVFIVLQMSLSFQ